VVASFPEGSAPVIRKKRLQKLIAREVEALTEERVFLSDAQVAEWIGMTAKELRKILPDLERSGFPPKDPQFGYFRYAPAVKAWLDRRYRVTPPVDPVQRSYPTSSKRGRFK
jgi:hypothetical protein